MKLVYVGESERRDIVVPGGYLPVVRGVPFDVDDAVGRSLVEQAIFEPAPDKAPTTKENS